jgi:hypothetical protein
VRSLTSVILTGLPGKRGRHSTLRRESVSLQPLRRTSPTLQVCRATDTFVDAVSTTDMFDQRTTTATAFRAQALSRPKTRLAWEKRKPASSAVKTRTALILVPNMSLTQARSNRPGDLRQRSTCRLITRSSLRLTQRHSNIPMPCSRSTTPTSPIRSRWHQTVDLFPATARYRFR